MITEQSTLRHIIEKELEKGNVITISDESYTYCGDSLIGATPDTHQLRIWDGDRFNKVSKGHIEASPSTNRIGEAYGTREWLEKAIPNGCQKKHVPAQNGNEAYTIWSRKKK